MSDHRTFAVARASNPPQGNPPPGNPPPNNPPTELPSAEQPPHRTALRRTTPPPNNPPPYNTPPNNPPRNNPPPNNPPPGNPPPGTHPSQGGDLSKPSSKNLLAVLDELNKREVQMLDTATEAMRACLKDVKIHCKCLSNTPGCTGHRSAQDKDYINRYSSMAELNSALANLVDAEQSLRTFLLQAVSQEGNVWQQGAEAQERKTAEFQEEFRRSVSVMNEESKPLRTILTPRRLGKVQDRAESDVGERGIARD